MFLFFNIRFANRLGILLALIDFTVFILVIFCYLGYRLYVANFVKQWLCLSIICCVLLRTPLDENEVLSFNVLWKNNGLTN